MRLAIPVLVLVLVALSSVHVECKEEKFGSLHLSMLKDIHEDMIKHRDEKEKEFQKMKEERKKQREELEKEKARLQDELRKDRERQFQQVKEANDEHHEQFKGILNQILTTVAASEEKKLGLHHLSLLQNISKTLEGTKQDNIRHLEELSLEDEDHHAKNKEQITKDQENLRRERDRQFKELKDARVQQAQELKDMFQNIMSMLAEAKDCYELYKSGIVKSGVYVIKPEGLQKNFYVYCEMEKDGGGWTVIQRRDNFGSPAESFNRRWNEYKDGFGKLSGEFWLGNERISALTRQKEMVLKVDVRDFKNVPQHATFNLFKVDDEISNYKLTVGQHVGKSAQSFSLSNGQTFATQDSNTSPEKSCAIAHASGWWFARGCAHTSNLNGARVDKTVGGITWDGETPLSYVEMKIRPIEKKAE